MFKEAGESLHDQRLSLSTVKRTDGGSATVKFFFCQVTGDYWQIRRRIFSRYILSS